MQQKVYFNGLGAFNDPFERHFKIQHVSVEYTLKNPEKLNTLLESYHESGEPDLTLAELKERIATKEFREQLSNAPLLLTDAFFDNHGALCLTADKSNIPMWAHYGDNHTGYCIEFKLNLDDHLGLTEDQCKEYLRSLKNGEDILSFHYKGISFVLTKVAYKSKPPTMVLEELYALKNNYEQTKYIVDHSVGVKFIQWGYENEFRLIANDVGNFDLKQCAPFLSVTGVILGRRMEKYYQQRIRDLCSRYGISVYQTNYSASDYEMVITPSVETNILEDSLK